MMKLGSISPLRTRPSSAARFVHVGLPHLHGQAFAGIIASTIHPHGQSFDIRASGKADYVVVPGSEQRGATYPLAHRDVQPCLAARRVGAALVLTGAPIEVGRPLVPRRLPRCL